MALKKIRVVKPEIRVVGIDDGVFSPHVKGFAPVIGVVFRGGYWLDGVMSTKVEVDGFDAGEKICRMIIESPHYKQLRIIMLDGVTFAGFNVVDIRELNRDTKLPVIAITREKPDFKEIHAALKNLPGKRRRWQAVLNAGEIFDVPTGHGNDKVYLETAGIQRDDARKIVKSTATRSSVPEPIRVAHIVASGVTAAIM